MSSPRPHSLILERGRGERVVRYTVLPGGLRIITESDPALRSASIGAWVRVGSVDETPALAGVSHFLEHVLFKGTDTRSAAQISGAIDRVGGELNAFTAHEYTCFYANVLAEDAEMATELICDVVLRARIGQADVDLERQVIIEEIAMRDDDPHDAVLEASAGQVFAGHPLATPIIGSVDSVSGLTRDQIHDFYQLWYQTPRMVIAVAGGIDHTDVVHWIESGFEGHRVHDASPVPVRTGPRVRYGEPSLELVSRDIEQAHLCLGLPGLAREDPDRYALSVLSTALGGGMSSRLFQTIREERGLAYTCYSSASAYAGGGSMSIYAATSPENLSDIAELIRAEVAAVAAGGVSADELDLAQGQLCGVTALSHQDVESKMNRLGRRALTRSHYLSIDDDLAAVRAVTADQVAAVARSLFDRPMSVAVLGPYGGQAELPMSVVDLMRRPVTDQR